MERKNLILYFTKVSFFKKRKKLPSNEDAFVGSTRELNKIAFIFFPPVFFSFLSSRKDMAIELFVEIIFRNIHPIFCCCC